jgi:hypothetical protein
MLLKVDEADFLYRALMFIKALVWREDDISWCVRASLIFVNRFHLSNFDLMERIDDFFLRHASYIETK